MFKIENFWTRQFNGKKAVHKGLEGVLEDLLM